MPNLSLNDDALAEFRAATGWYEARTRGLGTDFNDAVETKFSEIAGQPDRFPRIGRKYREAAVKDFPYRVIYRVEPGGDVLVVAVAHTKRRSGYWRGRK